MSQYTEVRKFFYHKTGVLWLKIKKDQDINCGHWKKVNENFEISIYNSKKSGNNERMFITDTYHLW